MAIRFIDTFNTLCRIANTLTKGCYEAEVRLEEGNEYLWLETAENGLHILIGYYEPDDEGFVNPVVMDRTFVHHKGPWTDPESIAKEAMRTLVHNRRHLLWWEKEYWN